MDDQLRRAILQIYPQAARILDIHSYRPGYLPYPARLSVQTTAGQTMVCVLKVSGDGERLAFEAQVLRALADLQLPVPQVLVGPAPIPGAPEPLTILLISEVPGQPLPWISLTDLATADRTCGLVHAAVDRLHALTPAVLAHPIATRLPSRTLASEAQLIRDHRSAWSDVPLFRDALQLVHAAIPRYRSPLVFSNGDYNPLNFLAADGALVGWIDFEHACFEDPYIGFAKFLLWANDDFGWGAGAKVGLVERFLYTHQVAPAAFLVRLVLRGLFHLQDSSPADPPHFMLQVIADAVERLGQDQDAR
jgi:aminoglycoside phosphotransferase